MDFYRLSERFCGHPYRTTRKSENRRIQFERCFVNTLELLPRHSLCFTSRPGTENGSFSSTLDSRDSILQLRMDSRAADSLFGGTNDGHDFFTSLDGANTSPKQSVQQRAVEYPQSAPTNSHATAQYSSASPGSTTQANNTQDPYAQAVKHAQAVSTYDPYAPSYASHLTTAYQTTSSVPSHLPATPYAPHITPCM